MNNDEPVRADQLEEVEGFLRTGAFQGRPEHAAKIARAFRAEANRIRGSRGADRGFLARLEKAAFKLDGIVNTARA